MKVTEKLENQSISEALLNTFLATGIINEEEHEYLKKKVTKMNGLSSKSIFIKNKLINDKTNESIQSKEDTI